MYHIKETKIPTLSEIARMCELADPSMNACICCQKDTGLRVCDLLSLNEDDIKEQIKMQTVPVHIPVHHKMTSMVTNTFLGPNAIDALQEYYQKADGNPLFDIRPTILHNRLKKLGLKAQVSTEDNPLTAFSLRKFFYLRMAEAGVPQEVIHYWLGHKVTSFFNPSISDMARIYMDAYKYIDIKSKYAVNVV